MVDRRLVVVFLENDHPEGEEMKFYEAIFIVRQEASASHVEAVTQDIIGLIQSIGGEVTKTEFCGLRTLAYPVKKNKKGYYVLLNIAFDGESIAELEKRFRLSEDIIRSLIVRVEKLENTPSALMRRGNENKEVRDNRQEKGE